MTDETGLPGTPDDEIVSAVLDGEATAAETAHVAGDPALTARLEVFRRVSESVATPVAPSAESRDAAVAAALAVHDSTHDASADDARADAGGPPASVTPMPRHRSTGRTWSIAAAVVAAIVLPLVAIAAFNSSGDQSDSFQETAGDQITTTADEADDGAGAASTTSSPTEATDAIGGIDPASDLGAIDDVQTLAAATNTARTSTEMSARADAPVTSVPAPPPVDVAPTTTTAPAGNAEAFGAVVGDDPCEIEAQAAEAGLGALVYTATVTFRGTPAWVHVFRSVDGSIEVAVVSATADCTTLATVRL